MKKSTVKRIGIRITMHIFNSLRENRAKVKIPLRIFRIKRNGIVTENEKDESVEWAYTNFS